MSTLTNIPKFELERTKKRSALKAGDWFYDEDEDLCYVSLYNGKLVITCFGADDQNFTFTKPLDDHIHSEECHYTLIAEIDLVVKSVSYRD